MMKVVVVEDDKGIIDAIGVGFEFRWPGVAIMGAMTGKEGIRLVRDESPDIVILDINLPDMTGFDVLKEIRKTSAVSSSMDTASAWKLPDPFSASSRKGSISELP